MFGQMFKNQALKSKLMHVFKQGHIHKKHETKGGTMFIYPHILHAERRDGNIEYVFTLPNGLDPDILQKKMYVFEQVFGEYIELYGGVKDFKLTVYKKPKEFIAYDYKYTDFKEHLKQYRLPIIAGKTIDDEWIAYDMTEDPHLLIAGETGAGKSSVVRSIVCTLIQYMNAENLHIYMADLKMQEFHIFRNIKHVKQIVTDETTLLAMLEMIMKEIKRRQELTASYEVGSVWEYNETAKEKLPYILVCIDEFAEAQDNEKILRIVERISSVGRTAGVFLINSTQRPDASAVPGKLKINLTVRMGLKVDSTLNSNMIGTPGAEKIIMPGRVILKQRSLREIQTPYVTIEKAKEILLPYKVKKPIDTTSNEIHSQATNPPKQDEITTWDDES